MYYNIFSTKDTWITSGSDPLTGEDFKDMNHGQDQILELKKHFYNETFDHQTRILISFGGTDLTSISSSVSDGTITNPKYYLRLYEYPGVLKRKLPGATKVITCLLLKFFTLD